MKATAIDQANLPPIEAIEIAGRDEIAALQLERLKWTVRHAYDNVAHYRRKLDEHGVKPDDITSLADLARLPFTTKADLRDTYPFGMFAVPREQLIRIHASSGTTGRPTVVGYTRNDIDTWSSAIARILRAAGVAPGDLLQNSYGYGLFTGGLGFHYGAERYGCTVVPVSGGMTARQVQLIMDFKPRAICVTPSYMLNILDEMDRQGIDPRSTGIEIGIFGAEPWTDEIRRGIEERAGIHAIDTYGLSEIVGPGVASECIEDKNGLYVWEDLFYPEIVDPQTGEVLPDGEFGELVFTTLTKEGLPMIRYRTRDLTRLMPGTVRSMRRIQKITGRSDDMMIIRGVNVFPTQIEELIMKEARFAPHYQIEIVREGNMDGLIVHTELEPSAAAGGGEAVVEVQKYLVAAVKQNIGISIRCEVHETGRVPRSEGKAQRVVDKRPK